MDPRILHNRNLFGIMLNLGLTSFGAFLGFGDIKPIIFNKESTVNNAFNGAGGFQPLWPYGLNGTSSNNLHTTVKAWVEQSQWPAWLMGVVDNSVELRKTSLARACQKGRALPCCLRCKVRRNECTICFKCKPDSVGSVFACGSCVCSQCFEKLYASNENYQADKMCCPHCRQKKLIRGLNQRGEAWLQDILQGKKHSEPKVPDPVDPLNENTNEGMTWLWYDFVEGVKSFVRGFWAAGGSPNVGAQVIRGLAGWGFRR